VRPNRSLILAAFAALRLILLMVEHRVYYIFRVLIRRQYPSSDPFGNGKERLGLPCIASAAIGQRGFAKDMVRTAFD